MFKKKSLGLRRNSFAIFLTITQLFAVAATLSSFNQTSGGISTEVMINGTNFSTTLTNDIVWFGAA